MLCSLNRSQYCCYCYLPSMWCVYGRPAVAQGTRAGPAGSYLLKYVPYFSIKHVLWVLIRIASASEAILMSTHNICLIENCRKLSFNYHQIIHFLQEPVLLLWLVTEYVIRIWSSGCRSRYQGWSGRFKFAQRPLCIVGRYYTFVVNYYVTDFCRTIFMRPFYEAVILLVAACIHYENIYESQTLRCMRYIHPVSVCQELSFTGVFI